MTTAIPRSLRTRFLLVVVGGVVIPLAIVGFWLASATERSGRALLRTRLDSALSQVVSGIGSRWVRVRSELLDIADDPVMQSSLALRGGTALASASAPQFGDGARAAMRATAGSMRIVLRGADGRVWSAVGGDSSARFEPVVAPVEGAGIVVSFPIAARATGAVLATIEARVRPEDIVPPVTAGSAGMGAVLGVADRETGAWLAPLPFDPALLEREEFDWAGDRWLVARRALDEPGLLIAAAAPLGPFTAPFEGTARRGALALLIVSAATLLLATLLTGRLTRSLEALAVAADGVSRGDLNRRIDLRTDDEVGRVARAFNRMVESLRKTLDELARRERLAGIHEFAASLAHEVRNPLTSIRINLQRATEQIPDDASLRRPLESALREITRLDRTVSGALRVARSGVGGADVVDVRIPLERAIQVATTAFEQAGATVNALHVSERSLLLRGDASALEQLFINVLLNAAQALPPGGRANVSAAVQDHFVEVVVEDNGQGVPRDMLERIFEPFVTSRKDGTGLGLPVARQIARGHGGDVVVESTEGFGTVVRVRLPLLQAPDASSASGVDVTS